MAVAAAEDEACMGAPARAAAEEARCGEAGLEPVASSVVAVVVAALPALVAVGAGEVALTVSLAEEVAAAVAVGVATEPFCGV